MIGSFILNSSFFFNKLSDLDKVLVLRDPISVKWTAILNINYTLDESTTSTPFIINDRPGSTYVLCIPEKEWNDFLDAMIEFAQDEFDAITKSFSLLY